MRNLFLASATAATLLSGLSFSAPAFAQAGSFQGSCRNTNSGNGMLTAECADGQGRYHFSSLPFTQCKGDIGNNNGMLSCNGATASGGQIVGGNNGGGNDDRGRGREEAAPALIDAFVRHPALRIDIAGNRLRLHSGQRNAAPMAPRRLRVALKIMLV